MPGHGCIINISAVYYQDLFTALPFYGTVHRKCMRPYSGAVGYWMLNRIVRGTPRKVLSFANHDYGKHGKISYSKCKKFAFVKNLHLLCRKISDDGFSGHNKERGP